MFAYAIKFCEPVSVSATLSNILWAWLIALQQMPECLEPQNKIHEIASEKGHISPCLAGCGGQSPVLSLYNSHQKLFHIYGASYDYNGWNFNYATFVVMIYKGWYSIEIQPPLAILQ